MNKYDDFLKKAIEKNRKNKLDLKVSNDKFWRLKTDGKSVYAIIKPLFDEKSEMPFLDYYNATFFVSRDKFLSYNNLDKSKCVISQFKKYHYENRFKLKKELNDIFFEKVYKKFNVLNKSVCNVFVIEDSTNEEFNNKVFLWNFGVKLKEKFISWYNITDEEIEKFGKERINIFAPDNNYVVNLKVKIGENGFVNYDDTESVVYKKVKDFLKYTKDTINLKDFEDDILLQDEKYFNYRVRRFINLINDTIYNLPVSENDKKTLLEYIKEFEKELKPNNEKQKDTKNTDNEKSEDVVADNTKDTEVEIPEIPDIDIDDEDIPF